MDLQNPVISWVILTVGLALAVHLIVNAALHLGAAIEERKRAGPEALGTPATPTMRSHARWFRIDLLLAAAIAAALIVYWR